MSSSFTVGLVQESVANDVQKNVDRAVARVREAADRGGKNARARERGKNAGPHGEVVGQRHQSGSVGDRRESQAVDDEEVSRDGETARLHKTSLSA